MLQATASKAKSAPRPKAPVIPVDSAVAAAAALDRERRRIASAPLPKLTGMAASLYQNVIVVLRQNKAVSASIFEVRMGRWFAGWWCCRRRASLREVLVLPEA